MKSNFDKLRPVYHTALCLIPPEEEWGPIQEIRKTYDKAYVRWMPHINFLFPFYDVEHFEEVQMKFEEILSKFPPFTVRFASFDYFSHSKNCVMWLKPITRPIGILKKIFKELIKVCPNLKKREGFTPHMTVGQFPKQQVQLRREQFSQRFEAFEFTCTGLQMIHRDGADDPFHIIRTVKFGDTLPKMMEAKVPVRIVTARSDYSSITDGISGIRVKLCFPPDGKEVTVVKKRIVIVLDVSGSMAGSGLRNAKISIKSLLRTTSVYKDQIIYQLVLFDSNATILHEFETANIEEKIKIVDLIKTRGSTNFAAAFEKTFECLKNCNGEEVTIIFFTDGQDNCSNEMQRRGVIDKGHQSLVARMNNFGYYTIGFTASHDAPFLTGITRQGLTQGTFQYVKESSQIEGAMQTIAELLEFRNISATLVLPDGKEEKVYLTDSGEFEEKEEEKKNDDEESEGEVIEEEEEEEEETQFGYEGCRFFSASLFLPSELMDQKLVLNVVDAMERHDITLIPIKKEIKDQKTKVKFFLDYLHSEILKSIGIVSQKTTEKVELQRVHKIVSDLDKEFDVIIKEVFKIRRRNTKKELMVQCQNLKALVARFFEAVRSGINKTLSNDKIAQLNAMAYQRVTKQGLKKKLDKRVAKNVAFFDKMDGIIERTVKKIDFMELREKMGEEAEKLGKCILTQANWIELLEEQYDCLCIGIDMTRSQAAIADPAQIQIKKVCPSFISGEGFLDSVMYSLSNNPTQDGGKSVHSGFDIGAKGGSVIRGISREDITGCMPLYIHEDHWKLAKLKMKPIFGWCCTLDPLGYAPSQITTVPFLVLMKAAEALAARPKSSFLKMQYELILRTCLEIYSDFRDSIWLQHNEEINLYGVSPIWDNYNISPIWRTKDKISKNQIFLMQLFCAMKNGDVMFQNQKKEIANLIQGVVEEEMRRIQFIIPELREYTEDPKKMRNFLFSFLGISEKEHVTPHVEEFKKTFLLKQSSGFMFQIQDILRQKEMADGLKEEEEEEEEEETEGEGGTKKKKKKTEVLMVQKKSKPMTGHFILDQIGETPVSINYNDKGKMSPFCVSLLKKWEGVFNQHVFPMVLGFEKVVFPQTNPVSIMSAMKPEQKMCMLIQNLKTHKNAMRREHVEKGMYLNPYTTPREYLHQLFVRTVESEKEGICTKYVNEMTGDTTSKKKKLFPLTKSMDEFAGILIGIANRSELFLVFEKMFQTRRVKKFVEKLEIFMNGKYKGIPLITDKKKGEYKYYQVNTDVDDIEHLVLSIFTIQYQVNKFNFDKFRELMVKRLSYKGFMEKREKVMNYLDYVERNNIKMAGIPVSRFAMSVGERFKVLKSIEKHLGVPVKSSQIVKELVFTNQTSSGQENFMIVTNGEEYVDIPYFRKIMIKRPSMSHFSVSDYISLYGSGRPSNQNDWEKDIGCKCNSVCCFRVKKDMLIIVNERILSEKVIYIASGINPRVLIQIPPKEFLRVLQEEGHKYDVLTVPTSIERRD